MLTRFLHFLITVVILYGIGLALLGLYGSMGQFTGGLADIWGINAGLGLAGAEISEAPASPSIPQTGELRAPPLSTPTPFLPVPPTWTPAPTKAPEQPAGQVAGAKPPAAPAPTSTPTATPFYTSTPRPAGPPVRIVIDKINLDAPVVIVPRLELRLGHDVFENWQAPNYFAAGWHEGSAMLGEKGNTVLSGHHNIDGMVFGRLLEVERGDFLTVYSNETAYRYVVSQVMTFEERYAPIEQRVENGRWLAPSDDERLTLVTCWPPDSNTYRLIVIAVPAD